MSATTLVLVRHGATAANLKQPYTLQGMRPDSDLAPEGLAQARAVARALAGCGATQVVASPLRRAWQTAQPIAETLQVELVSEPGLVEIDTGIWTGLTWEEIEARWPAESAAFHDDAERHGYLGGENLGQLRDRLLPVVERLAERHAGQTLVLVSHGVVIRALLAHWIGIPLRYARRLPNDNTGVSRVTVEGKKFKVRTVNQAEHLGLAGVG
ncbi:MAG: histidine phosphatase family protein [Gemmataceae bacterium]